MKVQNKTSNTIDVAVNQWGDDGSTGYFSIAPNKEGTWGRTDTRGFIMMIQRTGESGKPYYVFHNSIVFVSDNEIKDNNRKLKPLES